ncbi:RmlC-like cupin domain-containing protein [Mycena floridula]|nr:RmlC-like cupin domain-containing protein [Mycena floridula]
MERSESSTKTVLCLVLALEPTLPVNSKSIHMLSQPAGELEHKDSMGNTGVLKRCYLQPTSAGTGISHSEKTHGSKQVHFLQIWSVPSKSRLQPKYFTRHFSDAEKKDNWVRVVAPVEAEGVYADQRGGEGPTAFCRCTRHFSRRSSGYNVGPATGTTVKVTTGQGVEEVLKEGDGAYILTGNAKDIQVENLGDTAAEILLSENHLVITTFCVSKHGRPM